MSSLPYDRNAWNSGGDFDDVDKEQLRAIGSGLFCHLSFVNDLLSV